MSQMNLSGSMLNYERGQVVALARVLLDMEDSRVNGETAVVWKRTAWELCRVLNNSLGLNGTKDSFQPHMLNAGLYNAIIMLAEGYVPE